MLSMALAAASIGAALFGGATHLHRPLHLPRVAPGAACPISRIDSHVDWDRAAIFGGSGIGSGPVYPGLGGAHGRLDMPSRPDYPGPWYSAKVFWYAAPSYHGPVLIRGQRLDRPGSLRFGEPGLAREMKIAVHSEISWTGQPRGSRGAPSYLRARTSGCYGVQIDGRTFSRVVIFSITTG